MPEPRTCHLPNIMALTCIGIERLGQVKTLERQATDCVVSDITQLEERR